MKEGFLYSPELIQAEVQEATMPFPAEASPYVIKGQICSCYLCFCHSFESIAFTLNRYPPRFSSPHTGREASCSSLRDIQIALTMPTDLCDPSDRRRVQSPHLLTQPWYIQVLSGINNAVLAKSQSLHKTLPPLDTLFPKHKETRYFGSSTSNISVKPSQTAS